MLRALTPYGSSAVAPTRQCAAHAHPCRFAPGIEWPSLSKMRYGPIAFGRVAMGSEVTKSDRKGPSRKSADSDLTLPNFKPFQLATLADKVRRVTAGCSR